MKDENISRRVRDTHAVKQDGIGGIGREQRHLAPPLQAASDQTEIGYVGLRHSAGEIRRSLIEVDGEA